MVEQYRQISVEQYLTKINHSPNQVGPTLARQLEKKKEAVDTVIKIVANDYELTPEDLIGPSRRADIVQARHIAAHFLYMHTGLSYRGVALSLGRNDHSTAINAVQNVERLMETNPEFKERIENHPLSLKTV